MPGTKRRNWIALTAVVLLLCSSVTADTLHLRNGGKFEGRLVEKTATHYVFDVVGLGVQRFPVGQVLRVEETETVLDEYERRLKALDTTDADAHYRLGLWCEEQKLRKQAKAMFAKTLALNPDHAALRKKMGYVMVKGTWMKETAFREAVKKRATAIAHEMKSFLENHRLGRSRRLAAERLWYWPPEGWAPTRDTDRPGVRYIGPTVDGVPHEFTIEILPVGVKKARARIDRRIVLDTGFRGEGEDESVRAGTSRGTKFGYRSGEVDRPIAHFHALFGYGDRTLHVSITGYGFKPVYLELMLSDVLDTISFAPPPVIEKGLYGLRLPGPDWLDGDDYLRVLNEKIARAPRFEKILLEARAKTLRSSIESAGQTGRVICHRTNESQIRLTVRRKLGQSTIPMRQVMEDLRRGLRNDGSTHVTTLRVAGRDAGMLSIGSNGIGCHLCILSKGDVVYEFMAMGGTRGGGDMKAALLRVLGSFRIP